MSVRNSQLWGFVCPFWLVPVCVQTFSTIVNVSRHETESEAEMCASVYLVGHMQLVLYTATATGGARAPCVSGSRWTAEGSSLLRTLHVERNRATCSPTVRHSPPTVPPKPPSCLHTAPCYDAGLEKKLRSKCMIVSLIDKEWVYTSVTTARQHTAKHNLLFLVNVTCIYTTNPCFMS